MPPSRCRQIPICSSALARFRRHRPTNLAPPRRTSSETAPPARPQTPDRPERASAPCGDCYGKLPTRLDPIRAGWRALGGGIRPCANWVLGSTGATNAAAGRWARARPGGCSPAMCSVRACAAVFARHRPCSSRLLIQRQPADSTWLWYAAGLGRPWPATHFWPDLRWGAKAAGPWPPAWHAARPGAAGGLSLLRPVFLGHPDVSRDSSSLLERGGGWAALSLPLLMPGSFDDRRTGSCGPAYLALPCSPQTVLWCATPRQTFGRLIAGSRKPKLGQAKSGAN